MQMLFNVHRTIKKLSKHFSLESAFAMLEIPITSKNSSFFIAIYKMLYTTL